MPVISVLMSIYNEPIEWIEQAIDSILSQTFSDFEFIIVNDKPDRHENNVLLDKYSKKDNRIIIVNNETNLGLPKSLNKGILEAKGRYIARMDADDISLPERFARQIEFLDKHPEVGVCGTFAKKIDENNNIIGRIKLQSKSEDLKNAICFFVPFVHPTVMIRKEILLENNYDENCIIAQDYNLWLRLSDKTSFFNIPKTLFHYRVHTSQSQQKAGKKRSTSSRNYTDTICAKKLNLSDFYCNIFLRYRNGDSVKHNELLSLYSYIIDNTSDDNIKRYALFSYQKTLLKCGIKEFVLNNLLRKYPFLSIKALFTGLKMQCL